MKRKQALKQGLKHYFTGKPCIRGHISQRTTNDGVCTSCACGLSQEWQARNKDQYKAYQREWVNNNPTYEVEWRRANPAKRRQYALNYDRTKARAALSTYRKRNAGKVNARNNKRRADKLNRTPSWLTKKDFENINFFYECRPAGCHVDHIIPLNGKNVSGLHVPNNLQWLPAHDNIVKGNRY